jgi:hypothetical protein
MFVLKLIHTLFDRITSQMASNFCDNLELVSQNHSDRQQEQGRPPETRSHIIEA